jgi:thiol:disulfide interchange protein DsbD
MRLARPAAAALLAGAVVCLASSARADWLGDLAAPFESAMSSGSWAVALGIMFLAGLATSLTPCVYPMIAITVSVFGASEAKSKLHGAGLSSMYVLGMCALFTPIGLTAGLSGGMLGDYLASLWVLVPLAVFFVAMALSMFGAFELALPPSLQNRLAQMGGLGPKGAFVLGLVGGLIAAPCTGPVLGGLLGWITATQNALFGGTALFVYALGLGLPTWIVGTFAISLPKSGKWLEHVKSVFGIVMVGAAIWFLRDAIRISGVSLLDVIEGTPAWALAGIVPLVMGLLIGAVHLSYHDEGWLPKARKTLGIVLATAGGVILAIWVPAPEPLPPGSEIAWMDDYEAARELARRERRPLLVDFGASWCGACEELDRHTFSDRRVISEGRRFVPVRLDLSAGEDRETGERVLRTYRYSGLPLVVMHDATGEEAERITGFVEPERMLQVMRAVR